MNTENCQNCHGYHALGIGFPLFWFGFVFVEGQKDTY